MIGQRASPSLLYVRVSDGTVVLFRSIEVAVADWLDSMVMVGEGV